MPVAALHSNRMYVFCMLTKTQNMQSNRPCHMQHKYMYKRRHNIYTYIYIYIYIYYCCCCSCICICCCLLRSFSPLHVQITCLHFGQLFRLPVSPIYAYVSSTAGAATAHDGADAIGSLRLGCKFACSVAIKTGRKRCSAGLAVLAVLAGGFCSLGSAFMCDDSSSACVHRRCLLPPGPPGSRAFA